MAITKDDFNKGDKILIIKGIDKNMEGIITETFGTVIEAIVPDRAKKGKNTTTTIRYKKRKFLY